MSPARVPGSIEEYRKYGANRMLQGKLPLCAEMCSTKSLLAGDGEIIAQMYKACDQARLRFGLLGLGDYIKFSFIMMSLL